MIDKPKSSVTKMVDHLFRHKSGQMVSVLTRIFGFENIDLIEDAIQESLIKALHLWQFKGIPENPSAWMIQVAKNHILDQFRKEQRYAGEVCLKDLEISSEESIETKLRYRRELDEDVLCLMFATCHPLLKPDSQIALTLKTISGFSVQEIARAFLSNKEAVAKMITRAKTTLRQNKITLQIPPPDQLNMRLDAVLKVLYLMFNEGFSSAHNKELIREDFCFEAIRLAQKLCDHPVTTSPKIHALLALFFFQVARLDARHNEEHLFLPLAEQERKLWDQRLIGVGFYHFRLSANGNELSDYHLEAEIASYHILAEDFASTDWKRVLACYDKLLERKHSPVVALNKIIVLSKVKGASFALQELKKLEGSGKLKNYLPLYVATAQIQFENGMPKEAITSYNKAVDLAENDSIKRFLKNKVESLRN